MSLQLFFRIFVFNDFITKSVQNIQRKHKMSEFYLRVPRTEKSWCCKINCITVATCDAFPSIVNGYISGPNQYTVGSTIIFVCLNGYVIVGASQATCREDRTWSVNSPPTCGKINTHSKGVFVISKTVFRWDVSFLKTNNNALKNFRLAHKKRRWYVCLFCFFCFVLNGRSVQWHTWVLQD